MHNERLQRKIKHSNTESEKKLAIEEAHASLFSICLIFLVLAAAAAAATLSLRIYVHFRSLFRLYQLQK